MSVKITLEFADVPEALRALAALEARGSDDKIPGATPIDPFDAVPSATGAPPATETPKPKRTRATKPAPEQSVPASPPADTATTPAAAQAAAPAEGVTLDDAYLKALTESVLEVAATVNRDTALGILGKYKMADGVTPVKQCSALPKAHWVAVVTEAQAILENARAAKAATTSTSLI